MPIIAVINESTVLTDAEISDSITDFQTQVDRDFAPHWGGLGAIIHFVPKGGTPPANSWWIAVLDNSDQAGALGYHDLTPRGLPLAKIFAKTDQQYNLSWTVTLSHELLEMLADPYIDKCVFVQSANVQGKIYPLEVCDPVEDDSDGYYINKTLVSNFVLQSWFEPEPNPYQKCDFLGKLAKPFTLLPGGYYQYFGVNGGTGWKQVTAQLEVADQGEHVTEPPRVERFLVHGKRIDKRCKKHSEEGLKRSILTPPL